jgi:hypothetical protein
VIKQFIPGPVTRLAVLISGIGYKENRRYTRARIKWPVVMTTPNGLVDGRTQNLSLGGAFIQCREIPDLQENFRLVISARERLILVNAEVIWSNGESTSYRMGIRFTKISSDDRIFLSGVISAHI